MGENELNNALIEMYERAKAECNYNATRFHQMLLEHGGLFTAKRLLAVDEFQQGLATLWKCGCLDITVEALVLRPEFAHLFNDDELYQARKRLLDLGYEFNNEV